MRRYSKPKPSRGTQIPPPLRIEVLQADGRCVGLIVEMPDPCWGSLQLDHVRASHGMGMKSETVRGNLVSLCATHHMMKTRDGKKWRPPLLAYIERRDANKGAI